MDCKVFRQEMEESETGERLSTTAQAHVDSCAACRAFQQERLSLRQLVGSLGPVNAPPDFDFRLRARLAAAESASGNSFLQRVRFAPGLKAVSVAAAFVLLITAAVVFRQSQSGRVNAPATSENVVAVKANEGQPQSQDSKPPQLANAPQDEKPASVDNNSGVVKTGGSSQAGNDAEELAQEKRGRNAVAGKTVRPPVSSNEAAFSGAPLITRAGPSATSVMSDNATALLQVPSQPVRLILHDRQGTTRSVSLEPVIFGSQNFLERATLKATRSSDVEGIW